MLAEADMGMTNMAMDGASGRNRGDENLLVKFFLHPKLSNSRSAEEGRPIYVELPYIQIMQPGNKDSIVTRPATEMDKHRFAEHWRKYEAREDQNFVGEGTMLSEWPGVTRGQAEELKFFNVFTLEQLVAMSDSNAQGLMGIHVLKERAAAYLEASKDSATADALIAANSRIDELLTAVEDMKTQLTEVEDDE